MIIHGDSSNVLREMEGFRYIGIEREEEYVQIARARVNHWTPEPEPETTDYSDLPLFREGDNDE
jgi:hypothetical protein